MNATRWQLVQDLFESALVLPTAERETFVRSNCADGATAELIAEMLAADAVGASVLDRGVERLTGDLLSRSLATAVPPEEGFGPYRLVRLLGEGGMGVVWLAERTDTEAQVAVKFLPGAWLSPARRDRFMQEVRLLAKLRHSGIACLYDAGTLLDGTPWFAMEHVNGRPFAEYCRDIRSLKGLLQLFVSVCEAVQHAHSKGVIHRDLKPSNLLVEPDGTPKLLDFGIASELGQSSSPSGLTAVGMRFASPPYSAPEYIQDGTVTATSDVYSLGVILHQILTGCLVTAKQGGTGKVDAIADIAQFRPSLAVPTSLNSGMSHITNWQRVMHRISQSEWTDLDVLCLKATHSDPARRYQSVEAVARDIQHFLHNEPLEARPDSWTYSASKFLQRNALSVVASAVTVCLLLTMAVVFTVRLASARSAAVVEANRADRVQTFMMGLFANKGRPVDAPGKLTVEALVDRGSVEADALAQEPVLQADLYAALGQMYADIGNFAKSVVLYTKAFSIQEREPGISVESRIALRMQLSNSLSEQYKWDQCKELIADTIRFLAKNAPNDRLHRLQAEAEWGNVLGAQGKLKESETYLKSAVDGLEAEHAPMPVLVRSLISLSNTQYYLGHFADSDKSSRRLIELCRSTTAFTPQVSEAYEDIGSSALSRGQYAMAEQDLRRSVDLSNGWYGDNHPLAITRQSTLATILVYEKDYAEAASLLDHVVASSKNAWPPTSQYHGKILKPLGLLQLSEGHTDAALKTFERLLYLTQSGYKGDTYRSAEAYLLMAQAHIQNQDYRKAETLCRKALPILLKDRGETDVLTAQAHLHLGRALLHQTRWDEAEQQLNIAHTTYQSLNMQQTDLMQDCESDLEATRNARRAQHKDL